MELISCNTSSITPSPIPPTPEVPTYAYITTYETFFPGILKCNINQATGFLTDCANVYTVPSIMSAYGMAIQKFGSNTYLYLSPSDFSDSTVLQCNLDDPTAFLNCSTAQFFSYSLMGSTFYTAPNGTLYAYLTTYDTEGVLKCEMNNDGTMGSCIDAGAPIQSGMYNTTFQEINGQNFVYITSNTGNSTTALQKCLIDATGSFVNCSGQDLSTYGSNLGASNLVFHTVGSTLYGYISIVSGNSSTTGIAQCAVDTNGDFSSTCTRVTNTDSVNGFAITEINGTTFAYLPSLNGYSTVTQCTIDDTDGTFTNCINGAPSFIFPYPYNIVILSR